MTELRELWRKCREERTNYTRHLPPNTETARPWLQWLNKSNSVSWGRLGRFLGVPGSSLSRFANGGKLPPKHKPKLGIYYDRKLYDMPVKELRWAIENRQEI